MAALRPDSPLRLVLAYTLYGTLWIVGSDILVAWWVGDPGRMWVLASAKGLFFILATTCLLYVLVKRLVDRHIATEEALRESQLRWQFALEGSGDGLWDWNAATGRVYYSTRCKAMLGYEDHEVDDTLEEWEKRVHPADQAQAKTDLARHLSGETPVFHSEHRLRMKDGSYKWILDRGLVISRTPDGRPLRVIGTIVDISTRKSAEEQTADALAFARTVLEYSPIGLAVYGPDGGTVLANEASARIVGADVPALLRQNFREIESWRRYGLLAAAERALAANSEVKHSGPYASSFGRQRWLEARFVPFRYAGSQHLLLLLTDETEQQRNLAHLRLMETAIAAAPLGWVVTDAKGDIEWVNPCFTTMTGYTAEEVVGRNPRVLKSGQHSASFYAEMWAAIRRGEVWSGEMFNQRKDGGLYHESMTIVPIREAGGTIGHFVAIKKDITERVSLERQLARAQRLESIGMLASGIAHDLNNIFAPIMLSLELLKLKYPTADARKTLEMIEVAAQRGAGIVRQVLTFARGIDGERTSLQPKYLVKEAAQILGETLPRNIRVETDAGAGLPSVLCDATQLHQVLLNLAINARDAMPAGGRLVLGAREVQVDESRASRNPPLKPGRCIALTVTDNGSGIPAEVLEHIFEPFFTTKPHGKGTGLGLSTVYGIVRSHGGAVEVATKLGEGTVFTVLLPAVDGPVARGGSRPATAMPFEGDGRRVLVVDDEESIRLITLHALQRHGFIVEVAVDGAEALARFRTDPGRFAVIVTDLMMPHMNGRELMREIRRLAPTLPIIAASGMAEESAIGAGGGVEPSLSSLGVRTLLRKPFVEAELLDALRKELESG